MAKLKLTKTLIDCTRAEARDIELRDTIVPGFLCKITPAGSKVFMVQYRTNDGLRRKPSIGRFAELSVEQARLIASDLMAEVRRGHDPSARKAADRAAPTVDDLCKRFITDYCMMRNKPASVATYQRIIDVKIIPFMGYVKVKDVTRQHMTDFMKQNMHADTGQPRASYPEQDVQHGRGLGLSGRWHESLPPCAAQCRAGQDTVDHG